MAIFMITYDLDTPGQDYSALITALERVEAVRYQKSAWLVAALNDAVEVREFIRRYTDSNDRVFVAEITPDAAWASYRMMGQSGRWLLARRP